MVYTCVHKATDVLFKIEMECMKNVSFEGEMSVGNMSTLDDPSQRSGSHSHRNDCKNTDKSNHMLRGFRHSEVKCPRKQNPQCYIK